MRVPLQLNLKKSVAYYWPEQVREIDAQAIRRLGADGGNQLMERAGQSAFEILLQLWPGCQSVQVLCGAGNNGGDGYVLARLAKMRGLQVLVYFLADPAALRGEAADAYARAVDMDVEVLPWSDAATLDADVLVDALLGTGLAGEVRGAYRDAITSFNDSRRPVLALDIPSGLCAITGKALGLAVRADATLCFIAPKSGLLTGEAACFCGSIWLDDLDCAGDSLAFEPAGNLISFYSVLPALKPRPLNAHKGLFGRVLVVGGDYGFGGAAILAAGSALKAGAGAVTCATRDAHVQPGLSCFPDIMFRSTESREMLIELLNQCDVVAAGPGLGRSPWSEMCLQTVLDSGKPLVLDADALNLLGRTGWKNPHRVSLVITPHPGEASRLLDLSTEQINADRYKAAQRLADQLRGVLPFKGRRYNYQRQSYGRRQPGFPNVSLAWW
jgi:hydroxyethylthiazole kinase-like uncharacterized protein yjeF